MLLARHRTLVKQALAALGIDNFVLAIHDASFPGNPLDDAGRGSSCSNGGARLIEFAHALGFNAVQLGPTGQTTAENASPYDGTVFSRNILSIALRELTEKGPLGILLDKQTLEEATSTKPIRDDWVHHRHALTIHKRILRQAYQRFEATKTSEQITRLSAFKAKHASWLEYEVLYDVLCGLHDAPYFREWKQGDVAHPDQDLFGAIGIESATWKEQRRRKLLDEYANRVDEHAFYQFLAHEQHDALLRRVQALDMKLFGDLQVGFSAHDTWGLGDYFLRGYVMGAPPSRTNPEGQPWGYPLLDPQQYGSRGGGAIRLLSARMDKMFEEFDSVRIDHPHGLVCPWVYHSHDADSARAVRYGARLFSSPNLPDHPDLDQLSIVSAEQITPSLLRHADEWVQDLSDEQVDRYSVLFDVISSSAKRHDRSTSSLVCEVLSTMPKPLERVLAKYGLGRFRVVQKANLDDSRDVYRTENARPEDWVMLGTHDTKPAFLVAQTWSESAVGARWARYLGNRLALPAEEITRGGAGAIVHALFADMCASQARNVMVFFSDVFGLLDVYNIPGSIDESNWSLRLTPDFEARYFDKLRRGAALNLPRALAMALEARNDGQHDELIAALWLLSDEIQQ